MKGTTVVRSWSFSGARAGAVAWDGRASDGRRVSDGRYAFRVDVRDAGGNRTVASTAVVVDRTAGFLRWSRSFYPQDGDDLARNAALTWSLARDATTTLRLYDAGGRLVRTVWTGRHQSAGDRRWTWDGRRADGVMVPQGLYVARLTVASSLGTTVLERPVRVAAFTVTPSATRVRAGQTLRVTIRTIEPLRSRPVVTFRQPGRAAVSATATRLADGSWRAAFLVRSGGAGTATIGVRARDTGGRVNATSASVRVAS